MTLHEYQLLEQVRALYRGLPSVVTSTFIVTLVAMILLWSVFDHTLLLIWYSFTVVITFIRFYSWHRFNKATLTIENHQNWINHTLVGTFLSGFQLGLMLFLFTSEQFIYHLIIVSGIYGAFMGSAVASIAIYFPAYLCFTLPPTILFFIKSLSMGSNLFNDTAESNLTYISATLILVFFGVLTAIARNAQYSFNRMSELAFENEALVTEVIKQKDKAENAALEKTQFLAAASHDLRQPMHALGLYAGAFDNNKLDAESAGIVSKIQLSTDALNELLNSLLDISKLDANTVNYSPTDIKLMPLIESIVNQYSGTASINNNQIKQYLAPDTYVYCDQTLLTRVVRNLVDNSTKFTRDGEIELRTHQGEGSLELSISDNGPGIPESEQANIFKEFTQLNNPERDRQRGLGLGLAIVKRLCTLMSVELALKSSPGHGTCFTLSLPLSKREVTTLNDVSESKAVITPRLFNEIILVIDDEVQIRDGMRRVIERWRATVVTAEDADEAIEKFDQLGLAPSLILSDLRLRENKTGIDAIDKIREEFNEDVPAILITGDTSPDRLELLNTLSIPILNKPVSPALLYEAIQNALNSENSLNDAKE